MAGGQERELKRRIKSVQSTKKITKAMELIAASAASPRPSKRVAAARPYSEQHHPGDRQPGRGRRRRSDSPAVCSNSRRRSTTICLRRGRPVTGAWPAGTTPTVIRAHRAAPCEADRQRRARRPQLVTVGKKATELLPLSQASTSPPDFAGFLDATRPTRTPGPSGRASWPSASSRGAYYDQVKLVPTPSFLSVGSQIVTDVVQYMPLDREVLTLDEAESGQRRRGPARTDYEFEPSPDRDP